VTKEANAINETIKKYQESTASAEASREFHRENPEFCAETIAYFKRMGELAECAATKSDLNEHMETVTDVLGRQTSQIQGHERRINDLDYRVKHLEQLATHTKIAVDANTAISKQNLDLSQAISDTVNQLKTSVKAPTSKNTIKSIPWQFWLASSGGILLVFAMLTGQLSELVEIIKGAPKL